MNILLFSISELGLLTGAVETLGNLPDYQINVFSCHGLKWVKHSSKIRFHHECKATVGNTVLAELLRVISIQEIKAMLPVDIGAVDFVVRNLNALSDHVHLPPLPDVSHLEMVLNKSSFYQKAKEFGMPVPRTLLLENPTETMREVETMTFPIIIKPDIGLGGKGIQKFDDPESFKLFLRDYSNLNGYLVQEYHEGIDASLLILVEDGEPFGICLRSKWWDRENRSEFAYIRNFHSFECGWIEEIALKFLREIRFNGIANFDLRFDPVRKEAVFFELDSRLVASQTGMQFFGINLGNLLLRKALKLPGMSSLERARVGHFLTASSVLAWLLKKAWRGFDHPFPKTNLFVKIKDWRLLCMQSCYVIKTHRFFKVFR